MPSALIPPRRGYPAVRLAAQPVHRRPGRHGPLVLVPAPLKSPTPAIDRDRTVSRRSEPSSRATLMGEQPNPWTALPCGTAGSLCPSFLPARPVGLAVKRPCAITLDGRLPIGLRAPLGASVTLLEATTPVKLPAKRGPRNTRVSAGAPQGPYFNGGSTTTGVAASLPPAYPTHAGRQRSAKLQ